MSKSRPKKLVKSYSKSISEEFFFCDVVRKTQKMESSIKKEKLIEVFYFI